MESARSNTKDHVQTVLGPIDPDGLGYTLTHEHLLHDLPTRVFKKPPPSIIQHLEKSALSMEILGWIRQYPYSFYDNLEFSDESVRSAIREEMEFYKKIGGGTIVDNASIGLRHGNQHHFVKQLSQETGVNIILGTGFYVTESQRSYVLSMSEEQMAIKIKEDLLVGVDGSDVKCGVIGEIGCSWPLLPFERRSLTSTAVVQEELGCPAIIHPGRHQDSPEEIIRIFQEAGGKVSKTVMSHLDRTFCCEGEFAEFAKTGCFCELDLFGIEVSHYQQNEERDMPSDARRVELLHALINEGYTDKIVISHDIHTKHRLMKFGGHGYSHILINVVAKMLKRGISQEEVDKILSDNPKRWLSFH